MTTWKNQNGSNQPSFWQQTAQARQTPTSVLNIPIRMNQTYTSQAVAQQTPPPTPLPSTPAASTAAASTDTGYTPPAPPKPVTSPPAESSPPNTDIPPAQTPTPTNTPQKKPLWRTILQHAVILGLLILTTIGVLYYPTIEREFTYWWRNITNVERSSEEHPNALFAGEDGELKPYLEASEEERANEPVIPPDDRIVIDKIEVNAPVVLMDTTDNLGVLEWIERGVGHYPNTARPGEPGNAFLTGHSSYWWWDNGDHKFVFQHLEDLVIGDRITIYYNQQQFDYEVYEMETIKPQGEAANRVFDQDPYQDEPIITLMTCTPVGTSLNRLIVRAKQITPAPGGTNTVNESLLDEPEEIEEAPSTQQIDIRTEEAIEI